LRDVLIGVILGRKLDRCRRTTFHHLVARRG
jgi:hypothetical protein